jgi:hypothetical protein
MRTETDLTAPGRDPLGARSDRDASVKRAAADTDRALARDGGGVAE